ncbi:hypothetical protein LTR62_003012 [Meristemomyces frigidus]|uniref:Uncharacterized protein n=1 Tax=Meristemomyces frigidus TaxID=1508187 RepID=A0AAN7TQT3_9PEZI|nr:hypothetical protein LTR62_003012 [Meristemomyces frigidus]
MRYHLALVALTAAASISAAPILPPIGPLHDGSLSPLYGLAFPGLRSSHAPRSTGPQSTEHNLETVVTASRVINSNAEECKIWHVDFNGPEATPACKKWVSDSDDSTADVHLFAIQTVELAGQGLKCEEWHVETHDNYVKPVCGQSAIDQAWAKDIPGPRSVTSLRTKEEEADIYPSDVKILPERETDNEEDSTITISSSNEASNIEATEAHIAESYPSGLPIERPVVPAGAHVFGYPACREWNEDTGVCLKYGHGLLMHDGAVDDEEESA